MTAREIQRLLWIAIWPGLIGSGCTSEPKPSAKAPPKPPGQVAQTAQWGPAVEGVQCRIRPIKRLWRAEEPIAFKVDFINQGKRAFAFLDDGSAHAERILVDNRWHDRPRQGPAGGKPILLGPRDRLEDLSCQVSPSMALPLGPGLHTIQVAFLLEGLEIVSNPVDVEITSR